MPTSVTPELWRALLATAFTRTRAAHKEPGGSALSITFITRSGSLMLFSITGSA
jgi:hypothetical protein